MPDFTNSLAAGLDARRKVFYGATATLVLLDHARPGRRGYDAILPVTRGWHLAQSGDGELPVLELAESALVTAELIKKTVAFAINGKVYKTDANNFTAPTYPNKRVWKFTVKPTGEDYIE